MRKTISFLMGVLSVSCSAGEPAREDGALVSTMTEALHADLVDPQPGGSATQCFGMHCCPSGYGMRGLRDDQNQLLCRQVNQQHEDCFIDGPTERSGVHACPSGTYMRGVNSSRNRFLCCYERERGYSELNSEFVDGPSSPTQGFGMHVCPVPSGAGDALMTGANSATNEFLCAGTPSTPSTLASPVNFPALDPLAPRTFQNYVPSKTTQATWKAATRNWLSRQFNLPLNRSYLNVPSVTVQSTETVDGGVTRETVTYPSLVDGTPIPAYIFFPPNFTKTKFYPGVLVTHGHFGSAKDGAGADWGEAMHAVALYLAQNNYVTLAPDTRAFGNYIPSTQHQPDGSVTDEWQYAGACGDPGDTACQPNDLYDVAGQNYGSLAAQRLLDNLLSVTVLRAQASLSSVNVEGLSLGADQAMWVAAVDSRVTDVLLAGNYITFECLNAPGENHMCQTVPGVSENYGDPSVPRDQDLTLGQNLLLDAGDIAGLIAPNRLYAMFGAGFNDKVDGQYTQTAPGEFSPCSFLAASQARSVYSQLGVSGNFSGPDMKGFGGLGPAVTGMVHEIDNTSSLQFFQHSQTPPIDQLDYGNTCNGMHCCPQGKAIAGISMTRDNGVVGEERSDFICRDVLAPAREQCLVDTGSTQRSNMHACPAGYYLRGADPDANNFTCCHDIGAAPVLTPKNEIVDTSTSAQGIHTCGPARFMTGYHEVLDRLLCSTK